VREDMKMDKTSVAGIIMMILGALLIFGPWFLFPVCETEGMWIKPGIPMPCGYTARAEIVLGALVVIVGALLLWVKSRETRIVLGVMGVAMGVLSILVPVQIDGVCANQTHPCVLETRPALIVIGAVVILVSLLVVFWSARKK